MNRQILSRIKRIISSFRIVTGTAALLFTAGIQLSAATGGDAWRPEFGIGDLVAQPSPEVSAMLRHLDEEINHVDGSASISVPLYSWRSGDLNFSLSLRYRVGGYRLSERAGWTGLGWNLSGGGCVARTIVGMPDEQTPLSVKSSLQVSSDPQAHSYFKDLENHQFDAYPDRYSYTCAAGSGSFIVTGGKIIQTPQTANTIEFFGEEREGVRDFRIIAPDGIQYIFTEREHVDFRTRSDVLSTPERNDSYYNAVSAWHLSKVVSAGGETAEYKYSILSPWSRTDSSMATTYTITEDGVHGTGITLSSSHGARETGTAITEFRDQRIPESIVTRTAIVKFFSEARGNAYTEDIPRKLTSIKIFTPSGTCLREISLSVSSSDSDPSQLTGLEILSEGNLLDSHSFSYYPTRSHIPDIFGYSGNNTQYGRPVIDPSTGALNPQVLPDSSAVRARAINKHSNGLGLTTEYIYEPAAARTIRKTGTVSETYDFSAGIRLSSIIDTDTVTGRKRVRNLIYSEGTCDYDFSNVDIRAFTHVSGENRAEPFLGAGYGIVTTTSVSFLNRSCLPGFSTERVSILYPKVTEEISGTGIDSPIRTVYEFDLSKCRHTFVAATMPRITSTSRSLTTQYSIPPETPKGMVKALAFGGSFSGSYTETIGGRPLPFRRTDYIKEGAEYRPRITEQTFHIAADSINLQTGMVFGACVRDNITAEGVRKWDWQSSSDFCYGETRLCALTCLTDSVTVTHHFPDGKSRMATLKHMYAGNHILGSLKAADFRQDNIVVNPIKDSGNVIFGTDSISFAGSVRLYVGCRIREAGHVFEHYTAFSDMVGTPFFRNAAAAGQRALPVREIWIVDRTDTLTRSILYGVFSNCRRPVAFITSAPGGDVMESVSVTGYSPFGAPLGIRRNGSPDISYTWMTQASLADFPESVTSSGGGLSLTDSYSWQELTGCTSHTAPDGSSTLYGYTAGRLSSVTAPSGYEISRYEYSIRGSADSPVEDTYNRIVLKSRVADSGTTAAFATTESYHDGFGNKILDLRRDYGTARHLVSLTRYDALHRPLKVWTPQGLTSWQNLFTSEMALVNASGGAESYAWSEFTYPVSISSSPLTETIPGKDFAAKPSTRRETCSRTDLPLYRVLRLAVKGISLSVSGYYADAELDCEELTDGNGDKTLTFTDCTGNVVLTRRYHHTGVTADTYNVFDRWGKRLVTIQPMASANLTVDTPMPPLNGAVVAPYIFRFTYDSRMRVMTSSVPGGGTTRYAYDREGNLTYICTPEQEATARCTFILRDPLGRETLRGTCSTPPAFWNIDRSETTAPLKTVLSGAIGTGFLGSGYTAATGSQLPQTTPRLMAANYYDSYGFLSYGSATSENSPSDLNCNGHLTGTYSVVHNGDPDATSQEYLTEIIRYGSDGLESERETIYPSGRRVLTTVNRSVAGLPLTETSQLSAATGTSLFKTYTVNTYDPFGRQTKVTVRPSVSSRNIVSLAENSFDTRGNLSSVKTQGNITRSSLYDPCGRLNSWSMPNFSQQIKYGEGISGFDYTGRISAVTTTTGSRSGTYYYEYGVLGFLSEAEYNSSTHPSSNFSVRYKYDLQANIKSVIRYGALVGGDYGLIESATFGYSGNRISSLNLKSNSLIPLENQPLLRKSAATYSYDAAGRVISDPGRGIALVEWSEAGYPMRVITDAGEQILYRYSATGVKLSETYLDSEGSLLRTHEICGRFELTDGKVERVQVQCGYLDAAWKFHRYVPDYQGNIIGVVNTSTGLPEQVTNYYPYGTPHAGGMGETVNRKAFGGKDYTREFGVHTLDFEERPYSPLTGSFLAPDPLASDLPSISPYAYCAGDPVNLTDPTGMSPVYNKKGEYLGCTEEGFTGQILLYYGEDEIDFSKFSQATLERKYPDLFDTPYTGNMNIDGDALSNIWTHVVNHFEGMKIFDERFSLDNIENKKISYRNNLMYDDSAWETWTGKDKPIQYIYGNNTFTYESTVENLASSLIVHEWYSHSRKKYDDTDNHWKAYSNVMSYNEFWSKTTSEYKRQNVKLFLDHLVKSIQIRYLNN